MSEIKKYLLTFPISGPIDEEIDWTMSLSIQHTATIFEETSTRYSLEIPFYVSIILFDLALLTYQQHKFGYF